VDILIFEELDWLVGCMEGILISEGLLDVLGGSMGDNLRSEEFDIREDSREDSSIFEG
jgi:hypothetical protein